MTVRKTLVVDDSSAGPKSPAQIRAGAPYLMTAALR